jgi:PKD repeat protein
VELGSYNGTGLPNSPNYRLGPLDGSPCDTLGIDNVPVAKFRCTPDSNDYLTVQFTDLSHHEPAAWSWSFGDNTTSQGTSPVHTFPGDGAYEVCLTVSNGNGEDTYCKSLYLGVTGTEDVFGTKGEMLIYPNPTNGQVTVKHPTVEGTGLLSVFDKRGSLKYTLRLMEGQAQSQLALGGLPAGLYFVQYKNARQCITKKLSLQK